MVVLRFSNSPNHDGNRVSLLQRAIAYRLAIDGPSSNSRNDGMQKGMSGTSRDIGRKNTEGISDSISVTTATAPHKLKRYL